ncbi:Uma2 family endonuclease [Dactylosporangium sp. NPDC048998]|uniref:Uma2 family endonuclease n=1 Tax=Dactylosporangium sp. NPDC048998 TaxID=3363976 RepID=UPI00371F453C
MGKVAVLDRNGSQSEGLTVHDVLWGINHEEGFLYELHEGALRMAPTAGYEHQRLGYRLCRHFDDRGREATQEVGIQFDQYNFRIPDVARLRPGVVPPPRGPVAPDLFDLVIEVESPTTRDEDRIVKPKVYAQAGIPEYWRVQAEPSGYVVHIYRLEGVRYVETRVVPVEELFAEEA